MPITALPEPPSRGDPANFPERADAFMAALPQFAQEANVLQEQVDEAAVAADQRASDANSSAQAAETSNTQAAQAAGAAWGSMQSASSEAAAAEAARDLAQDWAAKPAGTVGGTPFLSAKQYAEQAAAGAGLPLYAANAIPDTDQGPIYVIGVGPMEWDETTERYEMALREHGQCQFRYVSATECRLYQHNGDGIIVGDRQFRIPEAGIPVGNSDLGNSVLYYAYLQNDSSSPVIEFSTTSHSTSRSGVEIKTGDESRTLVGMVLTTSVGQFRDDVIGRHTASYFNRRSRKWMQTYTNISSAATVTAQLGNGGIFLSWGEEVILRLASYVTSATAVAGIVLNGNIDSTLLMSGATTVPGINYSCTIAAQGFAVVAEGLHTIQLSGRVAGAPGFTVASATLSTEIET